MPFLSCMAERLVTNRIGRFTTLCMPVKLLEYVECRLPVICSRMKTASYYFDDSMIYYFDSLLANVCGCIQKMYFSVYTQFFGLI
ncbi:MAG: hypothetical protein HRT35_37330 [Algicola sp.]|nr:hypothetical protein [Algicola sp.]